MDTVVLLRCGVKTQGRTQFYSTVPYLKLAKVKQELKQESKDRKAFDYKEQTKGDTTSIEFKYYDSRGQMIHSIYKATVKEVIK